MSRPVSLHRLAPVLCNDMMTGKAPCGSSSEPGWPASWPPGGRMRPDRQLIEHAGTHDDLAGAAPALVTNLAITGAVLDADGGEPHLDLAEAGRREASSFQPSAAEVGFLSP